MDKDRLRPSGFLVVQIADDDDLDAVADALRDGLLARDGGQVANGATPDHRRRFPLSKASGILFSIARDHRPWRSDTHVAIADALAVDLSVVIIADDQPIPPEIAAIAEVATLPPLSPDVVAETMGLLLGEEVTGVPEAVAGLRLTDLRLAIDRSTGRADALDRIARIAKAREGTKSVPKDEAPRLEDLVGYGEAKDWGLALAQDLAALAAGTITWADVDRGLLLSGPPGVGKTFFAKALAKTCGVPLVVGSLGEWQASRGGHLGDLLAAMRRTFERARSVAPCVLFIDEIDGFGDRAKFSGDYVDYSIQVVNALLELLDGVEAREGVVVVAACNHPHRVDPALKRSGRLDRHVELSLPGAEDLAGILAHHISGNPPAPIDDLLPVARRLVGATPADVQKLVRDARRVARHAGRPFEPADVVALVDTRSAAAPEEFRRRVALHEAGHAVVANLLGLRIAGLSLSGIGGRTTLYADLPAPTRSAVLDHVTVLLAGRAAEEALLGEAATGSGIGEDSDLALATRLLAVLAVSAGLGGRGRLAWLGSDRDAVVLATRRPDIVASIDEDLSHCLEAAHAAVLARRVTLETIAARLLRDEAIGEADLIAMLEAEEPGDRRPPGS